MISREKFIVYTQKITCAFMRMSHYATRLDMLEKELEDTDMNTLEYFLRSQIITQISDMIAYMSETLVSDLVYKIRTTELDNAYSQDSVYLL